MLCLSQGGTNVFKSDRHADELRVGTAGGVFTLKRGGAGKWDVAGRSLDDCHVSSLLPVEGSDLLLAGAFKAGVFASEDGGKSFAPRGDGLSETDVYCLAQQQVDGHTRVYCGTEPAHLFQSDDLGKSWQDVDTINMVGSVEAWNFPWPPHLGHVKTMAFDPRDPNRMYVSVEQGALIKTEDGGKTWRDLDGFFKDVHRISISPSNPDSIFISTGAGLYHSDNAGETWTRLTTTATGIGYPDPLVVNPDNESLMFLAGSIGSPGVWPKAHLADSRILRSRDGGMNWERLTNGLPAMMRPNFEAVAMEVAAGSVHLFAGTTDGEVYFSDDEGDRWTVIADGLPAVAKWGHNFALMFEMGA